MTGTTITLYANNGNITEVRLVVRKTVSAECIRSDGKFYTIDRAASAENTFVYREIVPVDITELMQ